MKEIPISTPGSTDAGDPRISLLTDALNNGYIAHKDTCDAVKFGYVSYACTCGRNAFVDRLMAVLAPPSVSGSTDALFALLKQRDEALRYFEDHPDSYGAMASWETADDALRTAITRLSDSLAYSRRDSERLDWLERCCVEYTDEAGDDMNEVFAQFNGNLDVELMEGAGNLRAAIDAALSKSPPTEKP